MTKKVLALFVITAFAATGLFAVESIGGGLAFDTSRSRRTDNGRFWSQIYTGPWGFVDTGSFEFLLGFGVGRIARQSRWCFLLLTANVSMHWRMPVAVLGVSPLIGITFDAALWGRYECLRSAYTLSTLPGRPFREFSSLKLNLGLGRDFDFCEDGNRFFRAQLLGYYGRRLGNPHPWGGNLRLGVGKRL